MKKTGLRRLGSLILAVAIASPSFLADCGVLAPGDAPPLAQLIHRSATKRIAVAQVRRDGAARFELCSDVCPEPTAKTRAFRAQPFPAPRPVAALPSNAAAGASLSPSADDNSRRGRATE